MFLYKKHNFILISLEFIAKGPINNKTVFVLRKAWGPNRRQAIIWTNDDPLYRRTYVSLGHINTLGPRQDGQHFPDDIFKCISLKENV